MILPKVLTQKLEEVQQLYTNKNHENRKKKSEIIKKTTAVNSKLTKSPARPKALKSNKSKRITSNGEEKRKKQEKRIKVGIENKKVVKKLKKTQGSKNIQCDLQKPSIESKPSTGKPILDIKIPSAVHPERKITKKKNLSQKKGLELKKENYVSTSICFLLSFLDLDPS